MRILEETKLKNINKIYLLLIILTIILTGCKNDDINKIGNAKVATLIEKDLNSIVEANINKYKMDIILNEKEKSYTGKQKTIFKNNTGNPLGEIYFRIYPNAFKTFEGAPILFSETPYTKQSFKGGYIEIKDISSKGKDLKYKIEAKDETLLNIKLNEPLMEDLEIEIEMQYFVKLPTSQDRFGYGENTMNFGNWYPVLSVYDENGWSKDPYYSVGDPFYTDISNYDVNITVDKDTVVASSGNILKEEIIKDKKKYKIEGKLIRDFAFAASKDFKIREEEVDGTLVRLYYLKDKEELIKDSLKYSIDSIKTFNKAFGQYPYGTYSVVLAEFPSGMEYPNIVFIGKQYFNKAAKRILEQIIVHETAHQWWYGLIGNNEVKEAWLDEGLTSYSEVIYMDKVYSQEIGDEYFKSNILTGYDIMEEYLSGENNIVNKPLGEFEDWNDYSLLVYTKSAMFLRDMEDKYGKDILLKILQTYFKEYKYENTSTDDFLKICEEVTGDSFKPMNKKWLQ